MIWEPLNCGSFLEKVYLRLHKNVLEISLKQFTRENFKTRGTSFLNVIVIKKSFFNFALSSYNIGVRKNGEKKNNIYVIDRMSMACQPFQYLPFQRLLIVSNVDNYSACLPKMIWKEGVHDWANFS